MWRGWLAPPNGVQDTGAMKLLGPFAPPCPAYLACLPACLPAYLPKLAVAALSHTNNKSPFNLTQIGRNRVLGTGASLVCYGQSGHKTHPEVSTSAVLSERLDVDCGLGLKSPNRTIACYIW